MAAANDTTTPNLLKQIDLNLKGERAKRFMCAIYDIANAKKALLSAAALFPRCDLADEGEIDGDIAVEAFSNLIEDRLCLILSTIEGEDHISHPLTQKGGA